MPITIPLKKKTVETTVSAKDASAIVKESMSVRKAADLRSDDELLTLKQVANHLQTCTKTARRLIRDRKVPVYRAGRQLRVARADLHLLLIKE